MYNNRLKIVLFGAGVIALILVVLSVFCVIPITKNCSKTSVSGKLIFWGVDDVSAYQTVIDNYSKFYNRKVQIQYQQIPEADFENTFVRAVAKNQGPDILMFHNSWLIKQGDLLAPATDAQISLANIRQLFPQVVEKDFTYQSKVYALPLYLDTLALFYNKDIFNANAVVFPPANWSDFTNLATRLTKKQANGQILQSGAAIGSSDKNIVNATDVLNTLMLQYGSLIVDPSFMRTDFSGKATSAFDFYTGFAKPASSNYVWNQNLGNSFDLFSQGQAAMIFGYANQISYLKQKNPLLNFEVASMPQADPSNPKNYAAYWGLAVSSKSANSELAWSFIKYLTTDPQNSLTYLQATKRPPALKILIKQYQNDPDLNVFANQALAATSWYQPDSDQTSQIFSSAVESVLSGQLTSGRALEKAASQINNLFK
ncbi:MAG: extracellular solute-binding protein [Candidatus Wolfebacteria bacterium]|nr:extracellular solute-binding protein [Candidatus Wolfebacteria bacterium]